MDNKEIKIVYMGTPEFAVNALEAIIGAGYDVVACFTQPDKMKGRSGKPVPSPVKECALKYDIPVFQPEKLREAENVEILNHMNPDMIVVAAYGQILPESILNIPKYGCINIHASLLPKYRGAAPIEWCVLNGEKETGVTTMFMAKGLDTGDMIEKAVTPIGEAETAEELRARLTVIGAELIISTMDKVISGNYERTPQNDAESCYASMLKKEMGDINWNDPADKIARQIRGLQPWPCAVTSFQGKNLKIYKAEVVSDEAVGAGSVQNAGNNNGGEISESNPGEIIGRTKKNFTVKCGKDALKILSVQPEGKKQMDTAAFLNGNKLECGMKLGE